jgi:hypothetical protein
MSRHWRECRKDFKEHDTEQNRSLSARWDPLTDVWTFCGPGAGGEPEKVFKSLASKAARALPDSHGISIADRWKVWLDALRNEDRNFEKHPVEVILSPQECDRLDLRATKGVVESVMITDEMAAESERQLGFSTELGPKTQRRFEGTAGVTEIFLQRQQTTVWNWIAGNTHHRARHGRSNLSPKPLKLRLHLAPNNPEVSEYVRTSRSSA